MFCIICISACLVALFAKRTTRVRPDSELWLGCSCCMDVSAALIRIPGGPAMLAYDLTWDVSRARVAWIEWIELAIRANPTIRTIYVEEHDDRRCPYILSLFPRRVICDHMTPSTSIESMRRLLQSRFPSYVQLHNMDHRHNK